MKTAKERNRENMEYLKKMGFCTACHTRKADPGHATCTRCRENNRKKGAERYHRRVDAGLCVDCGKPAMQGRVCCKACNDKRARKMREKNERRKAHD